MSVNGTGRTTIIKEPKSKYNVSYDASKRECNGIIFDSALEMRYYRDVVLPALQNHTLIKCERQKTYELQPGFTRFDKKIAPINYKADFVLYYATGRVEVIDIKGYPDAVAKMKRKMFLYTYPDIVFCWIGYSKVDGGWIPYEVLMHNRETRKKLSDFMKNEKKDRKKKNDEEDAE